MVASAELESTLPEAFAAVERLPALAESRDRLLRLIEAGGVANDEIVMTVESDVALVIALLRLARAVAGPREQIVSVPQAVETLTRGEIEGVARSAAVFDFFQSGPAWEAAPDGFRLHAVAVQRSVDRVVRESGAGDRDELLTAALLHDIGKIVLAEASPGYPAAVHGDAQTPEERVTAERESLGTDHAQVGAMLARRWELSDSLADALAGHHEGGGSDWASLIRLADMLAHYQQGQAVDPEQLAALSASVGLDREQLSSLLYDLPSPLSAGRAPEPCPLSYREVEVLRRLSAGEVYKQIARELDLAPSTIRSHLHRIYKKLGVVDRAQAVLLASERGWI
jgi:putative nucleotidyltransferase with HDIG domain